MSERGERIESAPSSRVSAGLVRLGGRIAPWRAVVPYVAKLVRWEDWRASKLTFYLAGMSYAGLVHAAPGASLLGRMAALTAILCLFAAFGHLVNDYSDLEVDRAAGKKRPLADWPRPSVEGALLGLAAASLAIAVACFDAATIFLVGVSLLLGAAYSLPPARFKEKGALGWIFATLAQRTFPMAIIFEALGAWSAGAVGMTLLASLTGLRYIIRHQLIDLENDLRAGVTTAATIGGPERLQRLIEDRIFPLEVAAAVATVLAISIEAPLVGLAGLAYAAWLGMAYHRGLRLRGESYSVFYSFYYTILPLILSALLVNEAPIFLPIFVLTVAVTYPEFAKVAARVMPMYLKFSAHARSAAASASPPPQPRSAERAPAADTKAAPSPTLARKTQQAMSVAPKQSNQGTAEALAAQANRAPRDRRYPQYARVREREAVHITNWPGLGRGYFIMRHAEALTVLKDPRFLKRPPARWSSDGDVAPVRGFGVDLLESDPPDHTRLRKLVSKAFTPRMIERLEGRVESLAHELLDKHLPTGEIELVRDYAAAIPIMIITELLGIRVADLEKFRQFTYGLTFNMTSTTPSEALLDTRKRFTRYLEATFEQRRREPRDDLVTALVQAEQDGGRLSADELIGMVYLLLIAGYVTTVNLIANSTLSLIRNREQLELLRGDASLYPTAVEELLRYDGPLELSSAHFASADIELDGVMMPRGAQIRLVMPSINRDPARFERPDVLDLKRDPCPHLAFGQGIHYCLGAPLARLEGRIALRALIERAPNVRLAETVDGPWLSHPILRGPERLRLRF